MMILKYYSCLDSGLKLVTSYVTDFTNSHQAFFLLAKRLTVTRSLKSEIHKHGPHLIHGIWIYLVLFYCLRSCYHVASLIIVRAGVLQTPYENYTKGNLFPVRISVYQEALEAEHCTEAGQPTAVLTNPAHFPRAQLACHYHWYSKMFKNKLIFLLELFGVLIFF